MAAIIIFTLIALVVGLRTWIALKRFDQISSDAARARSRSEDGTSFPFNKFYFH